MIEIKNLSYKYKNGNLVLNDINFKINDGEILSIIGNNGAGKSTLLKIISGILKPIKGNIIIDDLDALQNLLKVDMKLLRKSTDKLSINCFSNKLEMESFCFHLFFCNFNCNSPDILGVLENLEFCTEKQKNSICYWGQRKMIYKFY